MSDDHPSSTGATHRDFLQSAGALANAPLLPAMAASAAANPTVETSDAPAVARSASVVGAGGTG